MDADSDDLLGAAQTAPPATLGPAYVPTITDSWVPHPSDPLRFVKAEIRQLLLRRGALSIAQLPEEYLKFYRRPLTQALKMVDSQYTPESARGGKPSGRARKATLGAFLREHLADAVEVRQRPHGQHEIVAFGTPRRACSASTARCRGIRVRRSDGCRSSGSSGSDGASPELFAAAATPTTATPEGTATPRAPHPRVHPAAAAATAAAAEAARRAA